jgi:hypothetical protein
MYEFLINTYLAIPQFALVLIIALSLFTVFIKLKTKGSTDLFALHAYKALKVGTVGFIILTLLIAMTSQLNTPRNSVEKIPTVDYSEEDSKAAGEPEVLKDRLLKPEPTEERQKRLDKALDFKERTEEILK